MSRLEPAGKRTFVLVHGAFHGGWCWRHVLSVLQGAGAAAFAPTLTGLGERAHLLRPGLDWRVFAEDVAGVIEAEELHDVVLVGHSFGGIVIAAVADQMPDRIRHLVLLDALVANNGESAFDVLPAETAAGRKQAAQAAGGLAIPVPDASVFGLPPGPDRDWVQRRLTPQPLASYLAPVSSAHAPGNGRPCTYVRCTNPLYDPVRPSQERAAATPGWNVVDFDACHDAMITAPDRLAELLLGIG